MTDKDAALVERLLATLERQASEIARLREALTPSGGTKYAYIGQFSWVEDFEYEGVLQGRKITVPWTTTKEIMKAISDRARQALQPDQSGGAK